jgi:hypothetical protein
MLMHPILDNLQSLRFFGMLKALEEQMKMSDIEKLSFEERFGLLVDREMADRQNRRFSTRLRKAKLRQNACVEDIDFRHQRGLDKSLIMQLASCQWIKEANNVPWHIKPASLTTVLSTSACRDFCNSLTLQKATAAIQKCSKALPKPICCLSMIGD